MVFFVSVVVVAVRFVRVIYVLFVFVRVIFICLSCLWLSWLFCLCFCCCHHHNHQTRSLDSARLRIKRMKHPYIMQGEGATYKYTDTPILRPIYGSQGRGWILCKIVFFLTTLEPNGRGQKNH